MCKDDILGFTKRVGKGNFLDIFFKNYLPRIYRTVERLNVGYLSSEENNIRGNDQESRVYKEREIIRKMEEDKEKIRVKVNVMKKKNVKEEVKGRRRMERIMVSEKVWEEELYKRGKTNKSWEKRNAEKKNRKENEGGEE